MTCVDTCNYINLLKVTLLDRQETYWRECSKEEKTYQRLPILCISADAEI